MQETRRYIDEKEVHRITGFALSTLRNHRHQGQGIPYYKVGRSVKYLLNEVYHFMDSNKIQPRGACRIDRAG